MYYVYLLKSKKDDSIYIGYTNNLKRRLDEHNDGLSQFTKSRRPFELVYYEAYKAQTDAEVREKRLKLHAQGKVQLKLRLRHSLGEGVSG